MVSRMSLLLPFLLRVGVEWIWGFVANSGRKPRFLEFLKLQQYFHYDFQMVSPESLCYWDRSRWSIQAGTRAAGKGQLCDYRVGALSCILAWTSWERSKIGFSDSQKPSSDDYFMELQSKLKNVQTLLVYASVCLPQDTVRRWGKRLVAHYRLGNKILVVSRYRYLLSHLVRLPIKILSGQ